jgi:hypothetical protein
MEALIIDFSTMDMDGNTHRLPRRTTYHKPGCHHVKLKAVIVQTRREANEAGNTPGRCCFTDARAAAAIAAYNAVQIANVQIVAQAGQTIEDEQEEYGQSSVDDDRSDSEKLCKICGRCLDEYDINLCDACRIDCSLCDMCGEVNDDWQHYGNLCMSCYSHLP